MSRRGVVDAEAKVSFSCTNKILKEVHVAITVYEYL